MNSPRLSFKEFDEDWKFLQLGEIVIALTSGSRDWAQHYSKTGSKFIRMTNLSRDGIQLKLDDLKFVNIESDSADGKRTSLIHGDILISITAELGKIGWIPPDFGEAFINQHTALVRIDNAKADSRCVAYLLSTTKLNKEINRMNDAGAKAGLNLPTIKAITFQLPAKQEQTKIANFLTAIDEKITQLTQKCDLLAQYKKGVMQQIFSQKLRFKDDDGREFPEWEEATLGDLFNIKAGGDISQENVSQKKDEIYKYPIFANSDKNFGLYGYSNQFKVNSDAITVTGRGNLGIAIPRFEPFYPIVRLLILIPKTKFNIYFGASAINKLDFFVESTGVPQLTAPQLSSFSIKFPIYEEQTKIANFLTAIDDKITQAQAQLEAVKLYKKGLLQQMFV